MLSQSEQAVREAIRASDAPVLGLLAQNFTTKMRTQIEFAVAEHASVDAYSRHLELYPALFAVNLAAVVMEGMGQAGHFELYSHIRKAIGVPRELSPSEREVLWKSFRQAVVRLGLTPSARTSGPHYMADEYLRQAGVPLAFADDLAERMLSFARRVGLPEEDDPETVAQWQAALESKLGLPFSKTARNAVGLDAQGYYTRVFLRVHNRNAEPSSGPAGALEVAMARAFKQQRMPDLRRAVLPHLTLRHGCLGVFIPSGADREFIVDIDGKSSTHRSGGEDKFVAIDSALPRNVVISEPLGQQSHEQVVWDDEKPNRLLIFSASGRFAQRAQLGQPESVILAPGLYTCLSRFAPQGVEVEEISDEPRLLSFTLVVHPAQVHTLRYGPAAVEIRGDVQPFAAWTGTSKTTREGVEFFYDQLNLVLEFPAELVSASRGRFSICITATGIGGVLELPVDVDITGRAVVDISSHATQQSWRAGFGRLLLEVSRPDETRTLLRGLVFYWHRLSAITEGLRFEFQERPSNLLELLNENVQIVENSLRPAMSLEKTMRLVFKLGERRNQTLTWNVPGVFVESETYSDSGNAVRRSRPLGSIEVVSIGSRKQLLISASDSGRLTLGMWSQWIDFSRISSKAISAAFLSSRVALDSNKLEYQNGRTGAKLELLTLVTPRYAEKVSSKLVGGQFCIEFHTPSDLGGLSIVATDMVSGLDIVVRLGANETDWTNHRFGRARLMVERKDIAHYVATAQIDLELWPSGAWVLQFEGLVDEVWGRLENKRQDQFCIGLLLDEHRLVDPAQLIACLPALTDKQSLGMLERVHEALRPCYALEGWATLQWLAIVHQALLFRWKGRAGDALGTLADLAGTRPPEDVAESWMLQQVVGAIVPEVFAAPANLYCRVSERSTTLSRSLRALSALDKRYPAVFHDLVHPAAAAGFTNFAAIQRGDLPRGFNPQRYVDALRAYGNPWEDNLRLTDDDFSPDSNEWLGPLHYKFAYRALERAYDRSLGGNEIRRGQALGLSRHLEQRFPRFDSQRLIVLRGQKPNLMPWESYSSDATFPEAEQKGQNLDQIVHLLSTFAYHCRADVREPGSVERFLSLLRVSGLPVTACLSYLLQVGEAVFTFYLILWELALRAEDVIGIENERSESYRAS